MTGLVRKATLLTVGGLMLAGAAMAGVPNPANCTLPTFVGIYDGGGTAIGAGLCADPLLDIVIRDALNNPVAGAEVRLVFSSCSPDAAVEECTAQPAPNNAFPAALISTGAPETIIYKADGAGELCLTMSGTGTLVSGGFPVATGPFPTCCVISAREPAGIFQTIGTVQVIITRNDINQDGLCNINDLSQTVTDTLLGPYSSRSDYSINGTMDVTDLSIQVAASLGFWTSRFGQGACVALP